MGVEKLKEQMRVKKIPYWKVAAKLGVHENTVMRMLRTELSKERQQILQDAISAIEREMKS